jgi:hypothetical protein
MQNDVCHEKTTAVVGYLATTWKAQSTDECGGVDERVVKLRGCYKYQLTSCLDHWTVEWLRDWQWNKLKIIQAIETINRSCAVSQAQLTRTFWCNESLPYPVNDCKQVRKVHPLLHTTGAD